MKKSFLFLISLFIVMNASAKDKPAIKGNAISATLIAYDVTTSFGKIIKGNEKSRTEITYNSFQYATSQIEFKDGQIVSENIREYDGEKQVMSTTKKNGLLSSIFLYDENGQIVKYESYKDGVLSGVTMYGNNQWGHTGDTTYNADGQLRFLTTYEYKDSLLMCSTVYQANGSVLSKHENIYDMNGVQIYARDSASYQKRADIISYEYDEQGRKKMIKRTSPDRMEITTTFNSHNEYGDLYLTVREVKNAKGTSTTATKYNFKYDDKGNWVEKITYTVVGAVETPTKIEERTIQYAE